MKEDDFSQSKQKFVKKRISIHLVSDSTGEVLGAISRLIGSYFEEIEFREFGWYMTKTQKQLDDILASISENVGIVMYIISSKEIAERLESFCKSLSITCIPAVDHIFDKFSAFLGVSSNEARFFDGRTAVKFTDEYMQKIKAIEYTLSHDDGNLVNDLDDADIILIGPSRTSKTPVSVYLCYRGYKVANIPFVSEHLIPVTYLKSLTRPLIIGLTINPDRLEEIRKTRLSYIGQEDNKNYANIEQISEEIKLAKRLYSKLNCFTIDVTQKSVEETSSYIINILTKHNISK